MTDAPERSAPTPAIVGVGLCIALHLWLCSAAATEIALDLDTVNLAYAIERFDVAHQAPHPPGYLLYVAALRVVAAIGPTPLQSVQWLAWLCSALTIALCYRLTRGAGGSLEAGLVASALGALHPFLLFHGVDAQTHNAEALSSALLLVALGAHARAAGVSTAAAIGACVALGAGLRPSFVVVAALPTLAAVATVPRHLATVVATAVVGCLLWALPTVHLSGGLAAFMAANDAFIGGAFLDHTPLSGGGMESMLPTLAYLTMLAAPLLVVQVLARGAPVEEEAALQRWTGLMLLGAVPFYLATYCSEPGYLQALVPPLTVWAALRVTAARRPGVAMVSALAVQLAILALPSGSTFKRPSIIELIHREVANRAYLEAARRSVEDGQPALVITDYPGQPIQRQLPRLDADFDVLWLFWPATSRVSGTTLAYGTATDMLPIPGPALLMDGPPTSTVAHRVHDHVVLDPFLSDAARTELRGQSACAIPRRRSDGKFVSLPSTCFSGRALRFGGHGLRLRPPPGRE